MKIQRVNRPNLNRNKGLQMLMAFLVIFSINARSQSYLSKDSEIEKPRIYAEIGYYFPSISTKLRIDSEKGRGTEIGLEDDFHLSENLNVFKVGALVDLKGPSQLLFSYTSLKRSREFVLDKTLNFGDTSFYLGASAKLRFDVNYYAATWRYSFFNELNWNAGLSLGLRGVQFGTKLEAEIARGPYSEGASVMAPAILFGVHGAGYLRPRLLARYSLESFFVDIEGISIYIIENNASIQYFITKNIGVGAAYSTNLYRIRDIPLSKEFDGRITFSFGGFNLFLSSRF